MKRRHFLQLAASAAAGAMARHSFADSFPLCCRLRITADAGLVADHACGPIRVRAGAAVRFHFLNAAVNEDVLLHLPGHRFTVIALDANPVPTPAAVEVLALAPGERVEATVEMNTPGNWLLGSVDDQLRAGGLSMPITYSNAGGPATWHSPVTVDWSYARFSAPIRSRLPPDDWTEILLEEAAPSGVHHWTGNGRRRLRIMNATGSTQSLRLPHHRVELTRVNQVPVAGIIKDTIRIERYNVLEADVL